MFEHGFSRSVTEFYSSVSVLFRVIRTVCSSASVLFRAFPCSFNSVRILRIYRIVLLEHGVSRIFTEICSSVSVLFRAFPCSLFVLYGSDGYYGYLVQLHPCISVCLRVRYLFCTDNTDNTDNFARTRSVTECHGILLICIRVFPCVSVFV